MANFRTLKQEFQRLLVHDEWRIELEAFLHLPLRKVLGPLFSLLLDQTPLIKWRAVSGFGLVTSRLADQDTESARVVMRRLMWNLNEESGAIGWGAPEAMGEIMACNGKLALEYNRILISYVQEPVSGDGNFLDHTPLRFGAYWGLGRLAQVRPELVQAAMATLLETVLHDEEAMSRACCVWALGHVGTADVARTLDVVLQDTREVEFYRDEFLRKYRVGEMAEEALARISQKVV